MGVTDGKVNDVALHGHLEAHADDFESLGEALAHTFHAVGDEGTAQAVLSVALAGVVLAGDGKVTIGDFVVQQAANRSLQGPLGAFHFDHIFTQLNFHTLGKFDGLFTYSRHMFSTLAEGQRQLRRDHQTSQRSSPPVLSAWAVMPSRTPREVDRMQMPRPF